MKTLSRCLVLFAFRELGLAARLRMTLQEPDYHASWLDGPSYLHGHAYTLKARSHALFELQQNNKGCIPPSHREDTNRL